MTKTSDQCPDPSSVLRVLFLAALRLSSDDLAAACGMTKGDAHDLVEGAALFSTMDAILIGRWLGTSPEFWLEMQQRRSLAICRDSSAEQISAVRPDPRSEKIAAVLDTTRPQEPPRG